MPLTDSTTAIIRWLLHLEDRTLSGTVHDLGDGAGLTRYGITQRWGSQTLPAAFWNERLVFNDAAITMATIFYYNHYWQPLALDKLPMPLAASVLSCAVNCGPHRAKLLLDVSGPDIKLFIDGWQAYYRALNKPQFLDGWLARSSCIYPELPS